MRAKGSISAQMQPGALVGKPCHLPATSQRGGSSARRVKHRQNRPMSKPCNAGTPIKESPISSDLINARDLSSVCDSIQPGLLIRAANPFQADPEATTNLGLQHMLDLRNPEEYAGEMERIDERWETMVKAEMIFDRDLGWQPAVSERSKDGGAILHRVSILDRERFQKALLFNSMDIFTVAKVIWGKVFDIDMMYSTIIEHINGGGLELLYKAMLESSKEEFCAALDTVLQAAEAGEPCVYFCKVGKDRTGLLSAMVLSIAGADDATIVADYAKSDAHGDMAFGNMERKELQGLDRALFKRAPAEAMEFTLGYCSAKYGSLPRYMEACGFSADKQERLRAALLNDAMKRSG